MELLTTMAKSLVNHPEDVSVKKSERGNTVVLELTVNPEDMGKVIGKQGRIARAIRSVLKAATPKDGKPVFLEIQQ